MSSAVLGTVDRRPLGATVRSALSVAVLSLIAAACSDVTTITSPDAERLDAKRTKTPTSTPLAAPATATVNPLAGATFYVDPYSRAKQTANAWRLTRPADATQMDKIGGQPIARWFGNWNADVYADVNSAMTTMSSYGATAVFVAYNIPLRDCGSYSAGGAASPEAYRQWITSFANGIGSGAAIVVLEPDALAAMGCLSAANQTTRLELLRYAVQTLVSKGNVKVYIDAGNPRWQTASTMAARLTSAGVASSAGFALNVSNFFTTTDNIAYGQTISALIGQKHFVIDTGRNGVGPTTDFQWCNPAGRALGARPTTNTGTALVDAFLWIKVPGESDGSCNGAPSAGSWMPEFALGLAQRAAY
jgi:endoglucanase